MNFNLVDGEYGYEKYEAIKEDYINSPLSCRKLQIKHNVSISIWNQIIKDIKAETGFSRKNNKKGTKVKNYTRLPDGRFRVTKHFTKKTISCGIYNTKDEAKMVVEKLNECGWDKSQLPRIKMELGL